MLDEIILILHNTNLSKEEKIDLLFDFHDNDLALALEELDIKDRLELYQILPNDRLSEIISYTEEPDQYLEELGIEKAAKVLNEMDSDVVSDLLEDYEEDEKAEILELVDQDTKEEVDLIDSYEEDEVGSLIKTNFVYIHKDNDVPTAMNTLVKYAKECDNFNIIYVLDENDQYYGQVPLKQLFIARRDTNLNDIIETNYPVFYDHDKIDDIYPLIQDYDLPLFPILNSKKQLIGVFTDSDVIDIINQEVQEDIQKFGAVSDDINERNFFKKSVKRLPWLITLLVLGVLISTVIGGFADVIASIPIIIFFQSLVLNMSGNVGTQSLAVTIRYLSDERSTKKDIFNVVLKEMFIGFLNGLIIGVISTIFMGFFIYIAKLNIAGGKDNTLGLAFLTSGVIGASLVIAMTVSSLVGTLIPIFFKKIHVDPALASGPFITTINDIVAVLAYYGLAYLLIFTLVLGGA